MNETPRHGRQGGTEGENATHAVSRSSLPDAPDNGHVAELIAFLDAHPDPDGDDLEAFRSLRDAAINESGGMLPGALRQRVIGFYQVAELRQRAQDEAHEEELKQIRQQVIDDLKRATDRRAVRRIPGHASQWAVEALAGLENPTEPEEDENVDLLGGLRDGAWLDDQEFPPLNYLVDGLIAEGLNLLVGAPKIGKSWKVLGIAARHRLRGSGAVRDPG